MFSLLFCILASCRVTSFRHAPTRHTHVRAPFLRGELSPSDGEPLDSSLPNTIKIGGQPLTPNSPEYNTEATLSSMESALAHSVDTGDFETSAELIKELNKLHLSDSGSVLAVNSHFYRTLSSGCVQDMENLWLNDDSIVCIHPGRDTISGYEPVLDR